MKYINVLSFCFLLLVSCNNSKVNKNVVEEIDVTSEVDNLSIPQRIANANGLDSWENVKEIRFTFNVDRGENHMERSWVWKPKNDEVKFIDSKDTIQYSRVKVDSLLFNTDAKFINDKYWLLAPLNLIWDQDNYTYTEQNNTISPILKDTLNQLTIVYKDEGGYTPGDAYDFYYNNDYIIKEWTYRQANNPKPSLTTTWENHKTFNGLNIAKDFVTADRGLKIYFTNIQVR